MVTAMDANKSERYADKVGIVVRIALTTVVVYTHPHLMVRVGDTEFSAGIVVATLIVIWWSPLKRLLTKLEEWM